MSETWGIRDCSICDHSREDSSCPECGGGTGYPGPPVIPPCKRCAFGIATPPDSSGGVLAIDDEETAAAPAASAPSSPTLTSGSKIESWRGLAAELVAMLGRVAADRGIERANQVALILHKQLRAEMGG